MVHTSGQLILLILNRNFQIWQDILEYNQQCVSLKCSHGSQLGCVVYDTYTVVDLLRNINWVYYWSNFKCVCKESACYSMGTIWR